MAEPMMSNSNDAPFVTLPVQVVISHEQVAGLLAAAFEGGSNYWYHIVSKTAPPQIEYRSHPTAIYTHIDFPMNPGGALHIADREEYMEDPAKATLHTLDREALVRGLGVMAAKFPRHMTDLVMGNDDAETGDVFLQCCLFGEIVYG